MPWILAFLLAAALVVWTRRRSAVPVSVDPRERMFEFSRQMGRAGELQDVLRTVATSVHQWGETSAVIVRLHSPRTRLYEARAFAGLDDDRIAHLSNVDITEEQFGGVSERAEAVGRSYRMSPDMADDFADASLISGGGVVLLVPLMGEAGSAVGYVAAQLRPELGEVEANNCAIHLEEVAILAVGAVRNARLLTELEHKRLELSLASEKLKELKRLKENFVGTVSHELRTPLTSVKAYAETLARSYDQLDSATAREFTDVIVKESDRLNQVFDDILDVEQLANGRLRMMSDDFSLRELVETAVDEFGAELKKKDIVCRVEAPSHDVVIHADRVAILQVLKNLLSNAIKFTPHEGDIKITLSEDVSMIRICVDDAGIGIPEEETERVFDRFHQVDNSPTRAYGGQGLGLSICRDIVRWHSGRIWAERSPLGGAGMVVLLPRKGFVVSPSTYDGGSPTERMERQTFLHILTSVISEIMGTRIVSLMLPQGNELRIEAAVGLEDDVVRGARLREGEGIAGTVWREGGSILVQDLDTDVRFSGRQNEIQYSTRSLLSCPVVVDDTFLGVINVNNKADGSQLDEDDRLLLESVAVRVGSALHSFARFRDGYRELNQVSDALRAIVDVGRERRTRLREMIIRCGLETARELGLGTPDLRALAFLLRTYDLGLSRVSEQVLRKVAPLSAEERDRIEDHVRVGAELAAGLQMPPRMLRILLHHHENFDGSGYPDGLTGEAIPIGSRLVRLVDAFGAALHDHPFRRRLPLDEAQLILEEGVGRRFCPRVTPVFLSVLERNRRALEGHLENIAFEPPTESPSEEPVGAGNLEA